MSMQDVFKRFCRYRTNEDININEVVEIIRNNNNVILLDVRSKQEYQEGHLNTSINIPLYELEYSAEKILKDKNSIIIVYCQSGIRSKTALQILKNKKYLNLFHLENGLDGI